MLQIIILICVYRYVRFGFLKSYLIRTICRSNIFVLKFFQWLSTNPNISDGKLDFLSELRDSCPHHSAEHTDNVIRQVFGKNIFSSFNPVPIASASIAQVHRAVIDGTEVAVKIKHPDLDTYVCEYRDLIGKMLNFFVPTVGRYIDFDKFYEGYLEQLDLNHEGECARIFYKRFENYDQIIIPRVFHSHRDLLVYKFEPSISFPRLPSMTTSEYRHILSLLLILTNDMILKHGIFHGDMHYSNWGMRDGRLVVYDFGFVCRIDISVAVNLGLSHELDAKLCLLRTVFTDANFEKLQERAGQIISFINTKKLNGNEEEIVRTIAEIGHHIDTNPLHDVVHYLQLYSYHRGVHVVAKRVNGETILFRDVLEGCLQYTDEPQHYKTITNILDKMSYFEEKIQKFELPEIHDIARNIVLLLYLHGALTVDIVNIWNQIDKEREQIRSKIGSNTAEERIGIFFLLDTRIRQSPDTNPCDIVEEMAQSVRQNLL